MTTTAAQSKSAPPLSAEQVETYHRDGFLVVPKLYEPETMLEWKRRVLALLEAEKFADKSGVRVFWENTLPDYFRAAMSDERAVPILKQLIGPDVEFLSVKAVFKNDSTRFQSPWHQDWFYWHGANKTSAWIALDDARVENGALMMIPGTHHGPMKMKHTEGNAFVFQIADEELEGLPVRTLEIGRGGAVFFSDLAVHSSHPNSTGKDRWAFISTYRDGSVKDDSLVWKSSLVVSGKSVNPPRRESGDASDPALSGAAIQK